METESQEEKEMSDIAMALLITIQNKNDEIAELKAWNERLKSGIAKEREEIIEMLVKLRTHHKDCFDLGDKTAFDKMLAISDAIKEIKERSNGN
jgi:hypothetical protein